MANPNQGQNQGQNAHQSQPVPAAVVDPVRQARIDVVNEVVRTAIKAFKINKDERYLLVIDSGKMAPDLAAELASGMSRLGISNVFLYLAPAGGATTMRMFKEEKES